MIYFSKIIKTPLPYLKLHQRILLKFFLIIFGKYIHVKNEHNLASISEPVIFAFNHNNSFETVLSALFLIYQRQGQQISFIVDWMYGKLPLIGWLLKQVDPIYVYNKPAKWKIMNRLKLGISNENVYTQCVKRLNQKQSIAIFPEGKRNKNPNVLMRGRTGIGEIVLQANVPVIPIGIDFPKRTNGGRIPSFGSVIFNSGEKMEFNEEVLLAKNYKQNKIIDKSQSRKLNIYLSKKVSHRIMMKLSELSGKSYPYQMPENKQFDWALPGK